MISIRKGTFETNSSSVHALAVMTDEQLNLFENEGWFLTCRNGWSDDSYYYDSITEAFEEETRRNPGGMEVIFYNELPASEDPHETRLRVLVPPEAIDTFIDQWVQEERDWYMSWREEEMEETGEDIPIDQDAYTYRPLSKDSIMCRESAWIESIPGTVGAYHIWWEE